MTDDYFRKDYQLARQWQLDREEERISRLKRLQNRGVSKVSLGEERLETLRREMQSAGQETKTRV